MSLEELLDEVDVQAIESIKERINACESKKYTSGVMYWRFQLRMLLKEIEDDKNDI